MTKNKKIVALLAGLLVMVVGVTLILVFVLTPKNTDNNATESGFDPSQQDDTTNKDVPPYTPEPEPDVTPTEGTKNMEEYLSGDSKPGLCASMQSLYVKEVLPAIEDTGYGELEKKTKEAAAKGKKIIEEDKEASQETKQTLTDLMTSLEDFGKYMSDVNSTNGQVEQSLSALTQNNEAAKKTCNW